MKDEGREERSTSEMLVVVYTFTCTNFHFNVQQVFIRVIQRICKFSSSLFIQEIKFSPIFNFPLLYCPYVKSELKSF